MLEKQLKILVNLATVDHNLDEKEVNLIKTIGAANDISDEQIDDMIKNPSDVGDLSSLTEDQRFEYLYNIVQLMKIDGKVYKSEIVYCQDIAEKLGYKKSAVAEISKRIYSDPSITADRDLIRQKLKKHLK